MAEKKFTITVRTPTAIAPGGSTGGFTTASLWTEPVQGTDRNTRIGNKIQTTWFSFRGYFEYGTANTGSDFSNIRLIVAIFTWKIDPPTTPVINDILINDGTPSTNIINQMMLPFDRDKISVLKSWRFTLGNKVQQATSSSNQPQSGIELFYSKAYKRMMAWENNDPSLITTKKEPYIFIAYGGVDVSASNQVISTQWASKMNYIDV